MATPIGPGPLIYAHRGASIDAPDNSLEAFAKAVEAGADGIELDVRRSADGVLILSHDPTHPRIGALAHAAHADIVAADPTIVTLKTALEKIPRSVFVNVEIKHRRGEPGFERNRSIVNDTVDLIEAVDEPSRIVVSSFDPFSVSRARQRAPEVLRGLLVPGQIGLAMAMRWAVRANHHALNLERGHVASDAAAVVVQARARGLAVVVWTVDDPDEMARLITAGVDAIITNDPATGRRVVDSL